MKLNSYFALYTRINIDLNVTRKTITFLEEDTGGKLLDMVLTMIFLI